METDELRRASHYSHDPIPTSVDTPFICTTRDPKVEQSHGKRGEGPRTPRRALMCSCSKRLSNVFGRIGAIGMFYIYPGRELSDLLAGLTSLFCERDEPGSTKY
jgi:hypothetical protein